jgi:hypothetical protein
MGIQITRESELGKELAKWEQPDYDPKQHPFPRMLYKAQRRPDGTVSVGEARDDLFGGQPGAAEAFSATCQMIVNDETELIRFVEMGWRQHPLEALEHFEEKEKFLSDATAHRHHDDRNMGDAAKKEAAAADAATAEHLPEVPRKPNRPKPQVRKPQGRRPKRA